MCQLNVTSRWQFIHVFCPIPPPPFSSHIAYVSSNGAQKRRTPMHAIGIRLCDRGVKIRACALCNNTKKKNSDGKPMCKKLLIASHAQWCANIRTYLGVPRSRGYVGGNVAHIATLVARAVCDINIVSREFATTAESATADRKTCEFVVCVCVCVLRGSERSRAVRGFVTGKPLDVYANEQTSANAPPPSRIDGKRKPMPMRITGTEITFHFSSTTTKNKTQRSGKLLARTRASCVWISLKSNTCIKNATYTHYKTGGRFYPAVHCRASSYSTIQKYAFGTMWCRCHHATDARRLVICVSCDIRVQIIYVYL